jgi:hypothetical protein
LENVSKLDSGWEYGREGRIGFGGRSGEEKKEKPSTLRFFLNDKEMFMINIVLILTLL